MKTLMELLRDCRCKGCSVELSCLSRTNLGTFFLFDRPNERYQDSLLFFQSSNQGRTVIAGFFFLCENCGTITPISVGGASPEFWKLPENYPIFRDWKEVVESIPPLAEKHEQFISTVHGTASLQEIIAENVSMFEVVRAFKYKHVLILGKDTGEFMNRLDAIAGCLRLLGLIPVIVKTLPDIPVQSNEEKVRCFADLSKCVLVENSFPAGQILELKVCSTNRIVTAMLREQGKGSSFLSTDFHADFKFMREFEYTTDDHSISRLECQITRAIIWSDIILKGREAIYSKLYPWRSDVNGV